MSTLKERLERHKAHFAKVAPPEARAIMTRATNDLRESGILDGVVQVGSPLPAFDLEDTEGKRVRSADLLARGPLVLTVYRGVW